MQTYGTLSMVNDLVSIAGCMAHIACCAPSIIFNKGLLLEVYKLAEYGTSIIALSPWTIQRNEHGSYSILIPLSVSRVGTMLMIVFIYQEEIYEYHAV